MASVRRRAKSTSRRSTMHGRATASPRRTRRTAAEARRVILDAAERRLLAAGPAGLRLQEVAADVGISHSAILHHFKSREDLVAAVVRRALEALQADLVHGLEAGQPDPITMVEEAFRILSEGGYGRLVVWLCLGGQLPRLEVPTWVRDIAAMAHARRRIDPLDDPPSFEDTVFRTMLVGLVIFGEASVGELIRRSAGVEDDEGAQGRFRVFLAGLLKM